MSQDLIKLEFPPAPIDPDLVRQTEEEWANIALPDSGGPLSDGASGVSKVLSLSPSEADHIRTEIGGVSTTLSTRLDTLEKRLKAHDSSLETILATLNRIETRADNTVLNLSTQVRNIVNPLRDQLEEIKQDLTEEATLRTASFRALADSSDSHEAVIRRQEELAAQIRAGQAQLDQTARMRRREIIREATGTDPVKRGTVRRLK